MLHLSVVIISSHYQRLLLNKASKSDLKVSKSIIVLNIVHSNLHPIFRRRVFPLFKAMWNEQPCRVPQS